MALIHQNLYREDNITGVNMKNYIPLLADNIFNSYNIKGDQVKIEYDIDDLQLDVATVIPIGLVLNELISNALKYAFPEDRKGLLKVSLLNKKNSLLLSVSDNGIGISSEAERAGFGTKLIQSFTRKLEGELHISSENGTNVEILIKNYKVA
jgi:two-component sensor histidine kinase